MSKWRKIKNKFDQKLDEVLYVTTIAFVIIIIFVSIILILKKSLTGNEASQASLSQMEITSEIS